MHTEAKHCESGSLIYTDAPKDHDGNGENFAPTNLLAASLGTCVITIMSIEAKRKCWILNEINIQIRKVIISEGPRQIKSLVLEIYMPFDLDYEKHEILKKVAKDCPVKLSLEKSIDI